MNICQYAKGEQFKQNDLITDTIGNRHLRVLTSNIVHKNSRIFDFPTGLQTIR